MVPFRAPHAFILVLAALLVATPVMAADSRLVLTASSSVEYDSNVEVEQTDRVTRRGDISLQLGASLRYRLLGDQSSGLTLGYDIDQTSHAELGDYDIAMHGLTAGAKTRVGGVDLGLDYRYAHMRLGGSSFLDMHMLMASAGTLVGRNVYLRAGYHFFDKDFRVENALDSRVRQMSGDVYYFLPGRRGHLVLGARYETENALSPYHDHDGFQLNARLQLKLAFPAQGSKLKLDYAYRERHYDALLPSLMAHRHEKRSILGLGADIPLGDVVSFKPQLRLSDRRSNYALADYRETIVTAGFAYHLR